MDWPGRVPLIWTISRSQVPSFQLLRSMAICLSASASSVGSRTEGMDGDGVCVRERRLVSGDFRLLRSMWVTDRRAK